MINNSEANKRRHITFDIPCAGAIIANLSRGASYMAALRGKLILSRLKREGVFLPLGFKIKTKVGPESLDHVINEWLGAKAQ